MKKSELFLSIIIPAFEEASLIGSSLDSIEAFLKQHHIMSKAEVIVVTADSSDDTARIVRAKRKNFQHFQFVEPGPRVGKGRDVKAGFAVAQGRYQLFTDADLATPLAHILPAIDKLEAGADVVIGIRDIHTMHEGFKRKVSSIMSNILIQALAVPGINDTQCGFKAFTRQAAEDLFPKLTITGWGFDIEVLALARRQKKLIESVDIDDWFDPKGDTGLVGDSKLSAMLKTLKELLSIRRKLWSGHYK